jgi:sRNA-binding regulator protein Hfq
MELNPNLDFRETFVEALAASVRVRLHMRNGEALEGKVSAVADHNVVIASLTGRELYDAVVRINDVSAIEIRARET